MRIRFGRGHTQLAIMQHLDQSQRFVRFGITGALGTGSYYLFLVVFVELLSLPVLTATSIAFGIVVLQNYVFHYTWTFESQRPHASAFVKFVITSLVGFGINWIVMFIGVREMTFNYLIVQGVAIALVVTWNFCVMSSWIFRSADVADIDVHEGISDKM